MCMGFGRSIGFGVRMRMARGVGSVTVAAVGAAAVFDPANERMKG